jgi:hypothetical protein
MAVIDHRILISHTLGNTNEFALDWGLSKAFPSESQWAIGYFTIHLNGQCFGVEAADATMLAVSYDQNCKRLRERGTHLAPFSSRGANDIAKAVVTACYSEVKYGERFFGLSEGDLKSFVYEKDILWAPDGDEAFDDGSHVLQFDIGNQVRLIGFVNKPTILETLQTIFEITIDAEQFYSTLQKWIDSINRARTDLLSSR